MENSNTQTLAIALGIPSATLISIILILVVRFHHKSQRRIENPTPTILTNSPATSTDVVDPYYGILLEQRPPRIVTPLPHRPIPINNFTRIAELFEGGIPELIHPDIPEEESPTPPGRREPIIILSPTTSTEDPPYAPRSPSPGDYTHYRENGQGFDMGHDIRVTAPPSRDHTWDANPAAPSAPVSPSEFWDNITIPYSTYFAAPRNGSPDH